MKSTLIISIILICALSLTAAAEEADFLIGDLMPDAPELAARGDYKVGVRTLEIVNQDQIDILSFSEKNENPTYDRALTLEIWYPAEIPAARKEMTRYKDHYFKNEALIYKGRALREAELDRSEGEYPLIIISHGYPGTRYMMSYLAENLASRGYVVAAISHTESTVRDQAGFASTLLNRPLDIEFTLDKISQFAEADSNHFLAEAVNADKTGLIGYSMGGYGVINAAGAGYTESAVNLNWGVPGGHLKIRQAGNEAYKNSLDDRIKAVFAMAPWGANNGFWNQETMKGLEVPTFFAAGDQDDVSGYQNGTKRLFDWAVNSDRYLLTFKNARHNIAPNAYGVSPLVSVEMTAADLMRYNEPVWDNRRLNNIMQHFATAFMGIYIKGKNYEEYLDLITNSNQGIWDQNQDGSFTEDHTHWIGFPKRTALGMELHFKKAE
ncbi:platelet-activating factor acetylhydrolase isoform II [Halanaerobium saccharolyticum]|uniref:Platelet-activating factor acetylhydrolase isoform II n=1 Tax=Halanaerobium saccharolyticum TaxID=43595 RepID=A0A4R6M4I5_9FIRM|nr:dienelactone hydrolase [Halanaerobium saccharolyticum]TDO94859.1 platelet-activating factor acetylhydrolase isoform II [Halanaerobium saccharolyticum]